MDFVGCFLPWDINFETGPNARQFFMETSEHVYVSHTYTKEIYFSATNKRKSQTTLT